VLDRTQHTYRTALSGGLDINGVACVADASGALFLESERLLVVADLHFEKGSAYAARRVFLPPYDTAATLARLARLMLRYAPRTIVALGDSFHDVRAGERMHAQDLSGLEALQRGRDWIWIAGNHDPDAPAQVAGERRAEVRVAGLTFRHEPQAGDAEGEVAGHLHPAARVASQSGSTRRRCFVTDGSRCVMPAFGAFAGGLNVRDAAFAPLFGARDIIVHALGRDRVYAVHGSRCLAD
jgi:DNA ligase-associated metallophosphoesterase